ncbi:40S ribosomal protein S5-1 [Hordeum vulgare]|nr:40S ribosomal protein S5-1 [Hordeum vulgare]
MREGMLHIRDVEEPKKTGSMETRLEAMEQQVFKCQGMVERGLNADHMMITEFTSKNRIDANDIGKHLSRLYDRIDKLQAQIYDLQNQNSLMEIHWSFARVTRVALEPCRCCISASSESSMPQWSSPELHWNFFGAISDALELAGDAGVTLELCRCCIRSPPL